MQFLNGADAKSGRLPNDLQLWWHFTWFPFPEDNLNPAVRLPIQNKLQLELVLSSSL